MTAKKTKKSDEAKAKARVERDKRMKRHADHTTIVLGLSMVAILLSLVAMVIGPWIVREMNFEANTAAVIELEAAEQMLRYSTSEVIREKTIADRFALDRKNKKKDATEFKAEHDRLYAIKEKKFAAIFDANHEYIEKVYAQLHGWAKTNKIRGIYSCKLDRDSSQLHDQYTWEDCTIYRDFATNISILCSDDKGCGDAALLPK